MFHVGPHDELVLKPDGAYTQLIRIQESHEENQDIDHQMFDQFSRSASFPLKWSTSRDSTGNNSQNSFTYPIELSSAFQFLEGNDEHGKNQKELDGDVELPKKAPMGRLARLNKPELLIIMLGSLSAAVHGVLFPIFGTMIASAIKSFYEPSDKLRRDSSYWALMSVVMGTLSIISVPAEHFFFGVAGGKLIERIRAMTFRSIVHQEISWFDNPKNSRYVIAFLLVSLPLDYVSLSFRR
jgi:ATP-binding cassette subfamily B (MDR/TAP) protein 1